MPVLKRTRRLIDKDREREPLTFAQTTRVIEREYGLKISRMTIWRWVHQGRKGGIKLSAYPGKGYEKTFFTDRKSIYEFMEKAFTATADEKEVLEMYRRQYYKADKNEDSNTALRAAELLGKTIPGFMKDTPVVNNTLQMLVMDETAKQEAEKLSRLRVSEILGNPETEIVTVKTLSVPDINKEEEVSNEPME
jgi:transposase